MKPICRDWQRGIVLAVVLLSVTASAVKAAPIESTVLLTLNSAGTCVGTSWTLKVSHAAPNAAIRLKGFSNDIPWEINPWANTDASGSYISGGTFAPEAAGRHTLQAEVANSLSGILRMEVVNCGWKNTSSLNTEIVHPTATLLANGKVLVMGRIPPLTAPGNAELYDPNSGTWSVTGKLNTIRTDYTSTLLPNGKVLVVGGSTYVQVSPTLYRGEALQSAELYDPDTGTWAFTAPLYSVRSYRTATLLLNGQVLVAAGIGLNATGDANYLYNPATETWKVTGSYPGFFDQTATATLLPSGKVLFVGVSEITRLEEDCIPMETAAAAALYDPATETWKTVASPRQPHIRHTATLLPNGTVLVRGETDAEVYDPETNTWSMPGVPKTFLAGHTATLLPNGKVLIAGGSFIWPPAIVNTTNTTDKAEVYDPGTGTWSEVAPLRTARHLHAATLLPNGKVLVTGGIGRQSLANMKSAELYDGGFGLPVLALNSTSYCIGASWELTVANGMPQASVRLMGKSNGESWEAPRWGTIDADAGLKASGTFEQAAVGAHTLRIDVGGVWSNAVSFSVSSCEP